MKLKRNVFEFLEGKTDPAIERQMRALGFEWAYQLRRRWKNLEVQLETSAESDSVVVR